MSKTIEKPEQDPVRRAEHDAAEVAGARLDAVVTHHRDSFRSGVGRFNELLAERLGVPLVGIRKVLSAGCTRPLLSFKVAELGAAEVATLATLVDTSPFSWELFQHVYDGLDVEVGLVAGAARVHCGNHEVYEQVLDVRRNHDEHARPDAPDLIAV